MAVQLYAATVESNETDPDVVAKNKRSSVSGRIRSWGEIVPPKRDNNNLWFPDIGMKEAPISSSTLSSSSRSSVAPRYDIMSRRMLSFIHVAFFQVGPKNPDNLQKSIQQKIDFYCFYARAPDQFKNSQIYKMEECKKIRYLGVSVLQYLSTKS